MLRVAKIRKRGKSPDELRHLRTAKDSADRKFVKSDKRSIASKKKLNPLLTLHQGGLYKAGGAASRPKGRKLSHKDQANNGSFRVADAKSIDSASKSSSSRSRSRRISIASDKIQPRRSPSIVKRKTSRSSSRRRLDAYPNPHPVFHRRTLSKDKRHDTSPSSIPLATDLSPSSSRTLEVNEGPGEPAQLPDGAPSTDVSAPPSFLLPLPSNIEKIGAMFSQYRLPTRTVHDLQFELARIQESCSNGLDNDSELRRMAREAGVELSGPWLTVVKDDGASSGVGGVSLGDLSASDLISIFCYCDTPSLVALRRTCKRFRILSGCREVWLARPDATEAHPKLNPPKDLKKKPVNHWTQMQEDDENEMVIWRSMYKNLEQRMEERVVAEHARKLPLSAENLYWKRDPEPPIPHRSEASKRKFFDLPSTSKSNSFELKKGGGDGESTTHDSDALQELWGQLKEIETLRDQLLKEIQQNNERFHAQQEELRQFHDYLAAGGEGARVCSDPFITFEDLERFERRMVSLILNGRGGGPEADSIPLVLRRGIDSFGGLELLLSNPTFWESENGEAEAVNASPRWCAWRAIQKRWAAFKAFFPLNDNGYYTARRCLMQCAMEGLNEEAARGLNKRHEKVLLRLTGVLRRVESMKESEVLDVIM
ncbi:unnamed protein product [Phytomonas sp. EM1]|nr:unnamed protein product [Phytomonas sp. EM1]|eukprot:CCW60574.1 unnamed protein product [Phytomonas sp. isolate EM1]